MWYGSDGLSNNLIFALKALNVGIYKYLHLFSFP